MLRRTADITVAQGKGLNGGHTIYQLREGVERFLITDINNPNASAAAQSSIPILWEMPWGSEKPGGTVLYMDGHVEWVNFPGKFPMEPEFIERLAGLMDKEAE